MGPNPPVGVVYHWLGGLSSGSCYLPHRAVKSWTYETYWLLQGLIAWVLAPLVISSMLVPNLGQILHQSPARGTELAYLWGMMWGIGGVAFGLGIRYLGQSLGYAIALGLTAALGTLMPPLFSGQFHEVVQQRSGQVILLGVFTCLAGLVLTGIAGAQKQRELTDEQKRRAIKEFNFTKGLVVAVFAGIMSACFAYALAAGKPIAELTKRNLLFAGRTDLWQNLPVLVVVLAGGFSSNFIWYLREILRNGSVRDLLGVLPPAGACANSAGATGIYRSRMNPKDLFTNYFCSFVTGLLWYLQFFFYSMGQTKMGKYDFSSWTLHMASIIIFSTLWGLILKEWHGSSLRTRAMVGSGLAVLVASTVIVGYGNYLKMGVVHVQSGVARMHPGPFVSR